MEKIKVIDLLNKIANGEEIPNEIVYKHKKYTYDNGIRDYYDKQLNCLFETLFQDDKEFLNDEVKILEEDKENK